MGRKYHQIDRYLAKNKKISDKIINARNVLYSKLQKLDIAGLSISEYNQRYLGDKIRIAKSVLARNGKLLELLVDSTGLDPADIVLVDYGGGSGMISYLAKELGIGTVIYNDIYDISCRDTQTVAKELKLAIDHIVCSDIDGLIRYVRENSIIVNAVISYDVIEHIYDIEDHFNKLKLLSEQPFCIVYGSGANTENPWYVRSVKQMQIDAETKDRARQWGHKERDCLKAYYQIRKEIINEHCPSLDKEQLEFITEKTRGLIKKDIIKYADEFQKNGQCGYEIGHPTNTCDPLTGNWCEHLMDPAWLEKTINNAGFKAEIIAGDAIEQSSPLRKLVDLLRVILKGPMFIAVYYVISARYTPKKQQGDHL